MENNFMQLDNLFHYNSSVLLMSTSTFTMKSYLTENINTLLRTNSSPQIQDAISYMTKVSGIK